MTFTVDSKITNLTVINEHIKQVMSSLNLTAELCADIFVCVDEVFSNIVFHAYKNREDGKIDIIVRADNKVFELVFIDYAQEFRWQSHSPELGKALLDRKNLGVGIFLLYRLMDELKYERTDGTNRLTLIKKIV